MKKDIVEHYSNLNTKISKLINDITKNNLVSEASVNSEAILTGSLTKPLCEVKFNNGDSIKIDRAVNFDSLEEQYFVVADLCHYRIGKSVDIEESIIHNFTLDELENYLENDSSILTDDYAKALDIQIDSVEKSFSLFDRLSKKELTPKEKEVYDKSVAQAQEALSFFKSKKEGVARMIDEQKHKDELQKENVVENSFNDTNNDLENETIDNVE